MNAALANVINAAVLAAGGGAGSNIATLTIYHGVEVTGVQVTWSGQCPGPNEAQPGGHVLGGGESKKVGEVHCGTPCPGHGTNCTATATVSTSVGPRSSGALWTVKIP